MSNLKNQKKMRKVGMIFFVTACIFLWSCEDKPDSSGLAYNPSKPVLVTGFEPDSGGMATKVFITGSNFGADVSKIRVYFDEVQAPVVGSDGNHLYVITPRLSGRREISISVVVGNDSVGFTEKSYLYRTLTTVTTIAGKKGTTEFTGGTLAEATFVTPMYLCIDAEDNIFLSEWANIIGGGSGGKVILINEEKYLVLELYNGSMGLGIPTPDAEGKTIVAPTDMGEGYYYFDPDVQWAPKSRLMLHPTNDMIAEGMVNFTIDYKASFATSIYDNGFIYTSAANGALVKFDPITRIGQLVDPLRAGAARLCFDPKEPHIMYMSYWSTNSIYRYDLKTREHVLYAGTPGIAGWKDGHRLQAEFNAPYQMVVDMDGSLVIAERYNHCIRKITPDGMVSTLIGKGGVAGYQDGNPEDALFDQPYGLAIKSDGTIYVADANNNVVRKLSVE